MSPYQTTDPRKVSTPELYKLLTGIVAPRPIAFVSTLDAAGRANVAPYSFFNVFSTNPPVAVFSSNRRVSDNTTKDTLANVQATGECVINLVSYDYVRQMALASLDWPHETSEFDVAGLTPLASDVVKAFRVRESPAQLECKVRDIITLGDGGGAGHLVLCDIWRVHVATSGLDAQGRPDPDRLDLVGRLGRANYVRASGEAVFRVVQPGSQPAIGWGALPAHLRESALLTGNELAQLAGLPQAPTAAEVQEVRAQDARVQEALAAGAVDRAQLHAYVRELLADGQAAYAARVGWIA